MGCSMTRHLIAVDRRPNRADSERSYGRTHCATYSRESVARGASGLRTGTDYDARAGH